MSGFLPPAVRDQIRAANDIVDVIGAVVPLKRAGGNWVGLCPFHKEKTPSFNVHPQKQIFHCFGCHKGGDVITFVREYEHLSFMEAVTRLADRAKIPLQWEASPQAAQSRFLKDRLLEIHEQICQRWHNTLVNEAGGEPGREYLRQRGVSLEAVTRFRLGFALPAWDDTVHWAKARGHDWETVEKAGLILRREEGGYYDRFRGRLIFPINDEQGRVVAFSGRVLVSEEKTAKYVNSPETEIFTKGRTLFGLDKSKRAILDAGAAIVCEGQLDLIACFMAGVTNVVAPQGTALTAEHARVLKRYADEVILCFDSDNAGQTAAIRVLDSLLEAGLTIRVTTLPAPHDPDSYIREFGVDGFRERLAKAQAFFDYYLDRLCIRNDLSSDRGQLAVVRDMASAVGKTANSVLLDRYAQRTALRLGVMPDAVRAEFRRTLRARPGVKVEPAAASQPVAAPWERPVSREHWLLRLLVLHPELWEWTAAHFDPAWVRHPTVRAAVATLLRLSPEDAGLQLSARLLDDDLSDEARSYLTETLAESRPLPNPEQQMRDLALALRNQHLDLERDRWVRRASDPTLTEAERLEALRQQTNIRAAKRLPLAPLADNVDAGQADQP